MKREIKIQIEHGRLYCEVQGKFCKLLQYDNREINFCAEYGNFKNGEDSPQWRHPDCLKAEGDIDD